MATMTFYPNASAVDGRVYRYAPLGETFSTIRAGAGTGHGSDANESLYLLYAQAGSGNFIFLTRSIFMFDTSALPDGATISSATFSLYGSDSSNTLSLSSGDAAISLVNSAPASTTSLANSDYGNLGTTQYASDYAFASWNTSGYNDFSLNATGIAAISLTGVTKFGVRSAVDRANGTPNWGGNDTQASVAGYYSAQSGTTQDPKLVVNYTASSIKTINGLVVASVKTVDGLAIANVKTFNGLT